MGRVAKGLAAGAAATAVLSILMVMKAAMGVMPQLDLPKMIAGVMGAPDTPALGWAIHAMIGIVGYGVAITLLDGRLPGNSATLHGARHDGADDDPGPAPDFRRCARLGLQSTVPI